MDYTTLSLGEVRSGLEEVARDAEATFGGLDARQLDWRPEPARWSVAQCFEHLLTTDRLIRRAAEDALDGSAPRTLWQRVPGLPGLFGRMLIRSQEPSSTRKFKASSVARPSSGEVPADVVRRFVELQRDTAAWLRTLDEGGAARTVMTSPLAGFVVYSVLDGCRLMVAHDRRHFEQARRVTQSPGFPGS